MLEIVAAGFTFRARFEEADAPATVAAFRAILPFEDRIIHCRWSGESNWIPWGDRDLGIGPENATSYPHPGEIALYPGGQSETELLFPYGYCNFASKAESAARSCSERRKIPELYAPHRPRSEDTTRTPARFGSGRSTSKGWSRAASLARVVSIRVISKA